MIHIIYIETLQVDLESLLYIVDSITNNIIIVYLIGIMKLVGIITK